jgi:hypothetical protein
VIDNLNLLAGVNSCKGDQLPQIQFRVVAETFRGSDDIVRPEGEAVGGNTEWLDIDQALRRLFA